MFISRSIKRYCEELDRYDAYNWSHRADFLSRLITYVRDEPDYWLIKFHGPNYMIKE